MKVLLISVNNEKDPYPVAPIGAAYVASALKNNGHSVDILDLCFAENDSRAVTHSIETFSPEIVGISIRNIDNLTYNKSVFYLPRIKQITEKIRTLTSAPIVVGGSGFSIFPGEVLRYLELEIGIVGEGETAFPLFVNAVADGGNITGIPNLCSLKNGIFSAARVDYEKKLCQPDRSILNNNAYLHLGGMANIQSKRGCPFSCTYCTYPSIEGKTLRLREPAEVVEELAAMNSAYGIDYVFFVDDIFNFPQSHAVSLCEELIRKDLKVDWTCFATPKGMTRELAVLMKRAGCKGVEFGSDAGSEATLKGLGKHFTPDDVAHAGKCCHDIDLPNAHYIIIGGPEEDSSTLSETFALFDEVRPTAIIAMVGVRIYPNTGLYYRALDESIIDEEKDLLEPSFYLTPKIDTLAILREVSVYAGQRGNWIVPGLSIRSDTNLLSFLRKTGRRGPLWDML